MGFRVGTEGGSVRGGEAATILGTHLSALLVDSWLPLPAREPGAGGGQCHQTASLETSPQIYWEAPFPSSGPVFLSHLPSLLSLGACVQLVR